MSAKIRKRREKLSKEVNGKCFWCGIITTTEQAKPNSATIDHLYTKLHPDQRYSPNTNNEERTVLACLTCNHNRGVLDQKSLATFTIVFVEAYGN